MTLRTLAGGKPLSGMLEGSLRRLEGTLKVRPKFGVINHIKMAMARVGFQRGGGFLVNMNMGKYMGGIWAIGKELIIGDSSTRGATGQRAIPKSKIIVSHIERIAQDEARRQRGL